jgi:structural maintenance of chromosome 4
LDFKNVSIVGHYIKERTKNAQFVIISLRNNMFELADRLVGIYKTNNTTKTVAINPGAFSVGRKKEKAADAEREGAENVAPAANGAIAA